MEAKFDSGNLEEFQTTQSLTTEGKVRIVPLVGHTRGHAGLIVNDGGVTYLMAGDATFDQDQTDRVAVCGASDPISFNHYYCPQSYAKSPRLI